MLDRHPPPAIDTNTHAQRRSARGETPERVRILVTTGVFDDVRHTFFFDPGQHLALYRTANGAQYQDGRLIRLPALKH